ncbi:MAG: AmmeMemoRadiSam system radical SAM enzyme [Candidatus Omnitrophica bacterium]|nr:AmmeMemoRadiSam system radical SAM enzyme [Candidatus Omnitrophota bacterium]
MKEAWFYNATENKNVTCFLCPHNCQIKPGERGQCNVRENINGKLYSLVYGKIIAEHIDPIEKKPIYHILPGSSSYSIGTVGCNLSCRNCQNWQISQLDKKSPIQGKDTTPKEIVKNAIESNCKSIAYTYTEPTIFYEFAYDCAVLARQSAIKNIFVSNGYMTPEVIHHLAPVLDAINIDLKAFTDTFYRRVCKAKMAPVLDAIRLFHESGVWVEVTTLIIPGLNDTAEELREIARFIKGVDAFMPWHVSAFHPTYKMTNRPPTPVASLRSARDIGLAAGLHHVYVGNVPGEGGENTICPVCKVELINRYGYRTRMGNFAHGRCSECGEKIRGVWY